jgi:hypothetical protein
MWKFRFRIVQLYWTNLDNFKSAGNYSEFLQRMYFSFILGRKFGEATFEMDSIGAHRRMTANIHNVTKFLHQTQQR